jgi:hypothetical protein
MMTTSGQAPRNEPPWIEAPWIEVPWRIELVRLIDRALPVVAAQLEAQETLPPEAVMLKRTRAALQSVRIRAVACYLPPPDGETGLGLVRFVADWVEDLNGPLMAAISAVERHYLASPAVDPRRPPLPDFTKVVFHEDGTTTPPIPDGQALITTTGGAVPDVWIWRRWPAPGRRASPINDHGIAKEAQARLAAEGLRIGKEAAPVDLICPPDLARLMVWPDVTVAPDVPIETLDVIDAKRRFLADWDASYPQTPPISHLFKHRLPDRWARIHSLPEAKRYPDTPVEWDELERRQNAVIDYLVPQGASLCVVINFIEIDNYLFEAFSPRNIGVHVDREGETVYQSFTFDMVWRSRRLDPLLAMIAEERLRAFLIAPDSLIAPYDGGVDVILKDSAARAAFQRQFAPWLSRREDGL